MAEKEYIEREAATKGLKEHLNYMLDGAPISQGTKDIYEMAYRHCIDKINSIPAADVRPVVRGRWISHDFVDMGKGRYTGSVECSACGRFLPLKENYCPNCGADMREES